MKTIVKAKDMEDDMFNFIDKWARDTFENKEKFRDESVIYVFYQQDVANYLKKQLEEKYREKDVCWHVIVGRHFGGYLTYQEKI